MKKPDRKMGAGGHRRWLQDFAAEPAKEPEKTKPTKVQMFTLNGEDVELDVVAEPVSKKDTDLDPFWRKQLGHQTQTEMVKSGISLDQAMAENRKISK